ncbi:uncharacterized protein LOC128555626 isoform X1 [Mercenaria mercenaria]|uniref:uncharacterized protein LOC128555626 isoform X1 n=1 Tax=Mercenaria mercenaria TaxID=6596 RepID=UPI00234F9161|nr:uncharacterized protein LOC128555626 isoform X1 [Mercenaria mercenaria]
MATARTEYYNRIDLITVRVGTAVVKKLFEKRVDDLKPENRDINTWNVDAFMEVNRRCILQKRPSETKKFHLYPKQPKQRDYTTWDSLTFIYVLIGVCKLDERTRGNLHKLRDIRNRVHHLNEPVMKLEDYQEILKHLKEILESCFTAINADNFKTAIMNEFYELEHGTLSVSDLTKFYHERTEQHKKQMESIMTKQSNDIRKIGKQLDELLKRKNQKEVNFPPEREGTDQTTDDINEQFDDPSLSPRHSEATESSIQQQSVGDSLPLYSGDQGNDQQCRECGEDTFIIQDLRISCDDESCSYWLHATCLLGPSHKITEDFVKNLPFLCKSHRK